MEISTIKVLSIPVLLLSWCSMRWDIHWAVLYAFGLYILLWLLIVIFILGYIFVRFHLTKGSYSHLPLPRKPSALALFGVYGKGGVDTCINSFRNVDGSFPPCIYHGAYVDGSHTVSFCDADVIKLVLTKLDNFIKFPPVYDAVRAYLGNGLVTSEGALWKKQRRLLTEMFHFGRLKSYLPQMHECASRFIDSLPLRPKCKDEQPGILLHAHHEFKDLTLESIVECAFGGDIDCKKVQALFTQLSQSLELAFMLDMVLGTFLSPFLPVPWSLLGMRSPYAIKEELDRITLDTIQRKRATWAAKTAEAKESDESDLVSEMFRAEEKTGERIPDYQIQAEAFTFLLAGTETSANTLAFTMECVSENPEVQARLQDEADAVAELKARAADGAVGNGSSPITADVLKRLPYTRATLEEVLRIHPVVPYLDRQVKSACKLGGHDIPAGSTVLVWFQAVANDDRYWNNAAKFDPTRFLRGPGHKPERHHPFSYVPFSAGPRNCIGRNFALQELTLVLAMMMRRYDVALVQKGVTTYETTVICDGGKVRLTPRK